MFELPEVIKIRNDLYCCMFEKIIEDQTLINCSQKVVAKESKLSVRSVTPYTKTQVNFFNGNQFYGDMNECRMNGIGRYLWSNDGSFYEGEFNRPNVIEGQGTFKFRNREMSTGWSKYCGAFANGTYHGKGQLINPFFKFNGNFHDGKFQGKGSLKWGDEGFDGWFENDEKICGKRVYSNGIFTGDFFDETRKFGKYEFDSGDVYFGSFESGMFSGFGEYIWRCSNNVEAKYIGNWRQNYRDGLGMMKVDGITFVTVFRKNVKDGAAVVWARNGKVYASPKMFHRDEFLGCNEIEIEHGNIDILRKLIDPKQFQMQNFKTIVSELVGKFGKTPTVPVYPFHVSWFDLNVKHAAIWDFIKEFPETDEGQEFISMSQTVREYDGTFLLLYKRYSEYSSKAAGKTDVGLLRVGLWQMMRDLGLFKKSSTFNSQLILNEADRQFNILSINSNDPFEAVSLSSLVQYLMYITLHLNKHHDFVLSCAVNQRSKIFGLFATMFVIFMREFLCPSLAILNFNGMIPKLIEDDRTFVTNFKRIVDFEREEFTIRSIFMIIEMWKRRQTKMNSKDDGNAEGIFLANLTRDETVSCVVEHLPFVMERNLIVDSEHQLNMLDAMELLIALVMKDISIMKRKQSLKEREQKLKIEKEIKKTRKSTIPLRRK